MNEKKRLYPKDWESLFNDIFTEEYLKREYLEKMVSINTLKQWHKCSRKAVEYFISKYNIPKRSIKESVNTVTCREQAKQTSLQNYGVANPSQADTIKNKKANTFLLNYGVDNIWKSKEYYTWLDDYMLSKFGKKELQMGPNNQ